MLEFWARNSVAAFVGCTISAILYFVWWYLFTNGQMRRLQLWAKGTDHFHYFEKGVYVHEDARWVRNKSAIFDAPQISGHIIEISNGPFKSPSASRIRARRGPMMWLLTQAWKFDRNTDWVRLEDTRGVSVERALRLINEFPSLEAVLDQLDELKRDLGSERSKREKLEERLADLDSNFKETDRLYLNLGAAVSAILTVINSDRSGSPSKFSRAVRKLLIDYSGCFPPIHRMENIRESAESALRSYLSRAM